MFCAQVSGAYSRTWSCREEALLAVYEKLMEVSVDTPKEDLRNMLRAAVFLVRKAIKDTVSSVSWDKFGAPVRNWQPKLQNLGVRIL